MACLGGARGLAPLKFPKIVNTSPIQFLFFFLLVWSWCPPLNHWFKAAHSSFTLPTHSELYKVISYPKTILKSPQFNWLGLGLCLFEEQISTKFVSSNFLIFFRASGAEILILSHLSQTILLKIITKLQIQPAGNSREATAFWWSNILTWKPCIF